MGQAILPEGTMWNEEEGTSPDGLARYHRRERIMLGQHDDVGRLERGDAATPNVQLLDTARLGRKGARRTTIGATMLQRLRQAREAFDRKRTWGELFKARDQIRK